MSRKLGDGFSLALNVGNGLHLTLVYFYRLKRGWEQELAKKMATDYFAETDLQTINLEFGEKHNDRSVKVVGQIEQIVSDLAKLFASFQIDDKQIPHIDLRGKTVEDINEVVSVVNNWYI